MLHDSRGTGPWVFFGIGLAAILIANTLQGRERQPANGETAHLVAVLGETERTADPQPFTSGTVTSVMGHSVLDLRRATLAPGAEATIDVFALMGGAQILVPEGWTVDTRTIPVFGGIHDERRRVSIANDDAAGPAPRLVLHGVVMMGGLEIK